MAKDSAKSEVPASRVGLWSLALLLAVSVLGLFAGLWKLLGIAWVAFTAMTVGARLGARAGGRSSASGLVWAYGLCSGAMITSAAVFLVPPAIGHHPAGGGFGIAAGIVIGFAIHTLAHQVTHTRLPIDATALQLAAHALAAGCIIGLVYATMPGLGPLLGLAIVSHKAPAGYAAARRLRQANRTWTALLLPAGGVGITALPVGLLSLPTHPVFNGVVFGFAAGVFIHLAIDFLPDCETGGEIHETAGLSRDDHHALDRLRLHAVISTALGGAAVCLAWLVLR